MKKLFILGTIVVSALSYSQVGIGTQAPHPSSDLELGSTNKALLLNRVTNLSAVQNPVSGMIVYDISDDCLKAFGTAGWSSCMTTGSSGSVTSLSCSSAVVQGALFVGVPSTGVSAQIPYTGGNGGAYSAQTIPSTGVTGLTATLEAGNFANGNGNLTYTITGTPSAQGTASFAINKGGQTCTLSISVTTSPVPSSVTLMANAKRFIASVYDTDYLPYTAPTGPATTAMVNANNSADPTLDYQGVITTTGISIRIPVTVTANGTLSAYQNTINIPAALTQDGVSRNLTLSWPSQSVTTATTFITGTIVSQGGTLNVKKLDLNAGIGNDRQGVLIGSFSYPSNSSGTAGSLQLRAFAAIPDRMFGVADNTGSTTSHMFLYLPVRGEEGKIWLQHNLGAVYTDLNHPEFNPGFLPTDRYDVYAHGSVFQQGRKPDGHELVKFERGAAPVVTPVTNVRSDNPSHAMFIFVNNAPNDGWRVNNNYTLWRNENSSNNPCPVGFRPAQYPEYETLGNAGSNSSTIFNSSLKFVHTYSRHNIMEQYNGSSVYHTGGDVTVPTNIVLAILRQTAIVTGNRTNANFAGNAVRCIQN